MNGTIKIDPPKVIKENKKAILCADIFDNGIKKSLSYIVDNRYSEYLVTERSDAFLIAILYYAMINALDIEWSVPCDKELIYKLEKFVIPVYCKQMRFMHNITLSGPVSVEKLPKNKHGVATGLSNGVDSLYTVKEYSGSRYDEFNLSHVIFTDFFITDNSEKYQRDFLESYLSVLPGCASELGLDFVYVNFRPDIDFSIGHIFDKECGVIENAGLFTLKYCSIAMALGKLIDIYYFSSGVTPSDFTFRSNDTAYYDIFTLPLISTGYIKFYSSGMEMKRIDKVKHIADWQYAQEHLQVCAINNSSNCGRCSKCIRTMSELYSIKKLDLFDYRFPLDDYKIHLAKRVGYVMMKAQKGSVFENDILEEFKKNKINVPFKAYFYKLFYLVMDFFRVRLRTNKFARKIYRRFGLDRALYGRSTRDFSLSVDKEILNK